LRATSQNSSKTNCDEPVEGARSLIATSRLSRNTYMSVASLADGAKRAAFAPLSAADALASKTSALRPSENTLRSILCPYWYVTDPPPVAPSVDSLFELSEKTWMSLGGIVGRKSVKSFAACSFVRPCGPEILFVTSRRDSRAIHGGWAIRLTDSAFGRASTRRAKRVFPCLEQVILSARKRKG
jgi:hypothetical protein